VQAELPAQPRMTGSRSSMLCRMICHTICHVLGRVLGRVLAPLPLA
jgi:hypothetical protein